MKYVDRGGSGVDEARAIGIDAGIVAEGDVVVAASGDTCRSPPSLPRSGPSGRCGRTCLNR
jgi:hypothetical protein